MVLLVTGGNGYIGSHTVLQLLKESKEESKIVIVDNLSNSRPLIFARLCQVAIQTEKHIELEHCDMLNQNQLNKVFVKHNVTKIIHFAALKDVKESIEFPLKYYHHNLTMMVNLLECMEQHDVKKLVFSSSATVYGGSPHTTFQEPLQEDMYNPSTGQSLGPVHCAYARTKRYIEEMLHDVTRVHKDWSVVVLRYFNPVGACPEHGIGEWSVSHCKNVVPIILSMAKKQQQQQQQQEEEEKQTTFKIFGADYDTKDGTCERDYIHVLDLANGHVAALQHLNTFQGELHTFNLGTGHPTSVKMLLEVSEMVTGQPIAYTIENRRPGDLPVVYAKPDLANEVLHWSAQYSLEKMIQDAWQWELVKNLNG